MQNSLDWVEFRWQLKLRCWRIDLLQFNLIDPGKSSDTAKDIASASSESSDSNHEAAGYLEHSRNLDGGFLAPHGLCFRKPVK